MLQPRQCDDGGRRGTGDSSLIPVLLRLPKAGRGTLVLLLGPVLMISCSKVAPPETTDESTRPAPSVAVVTPAPSKPHSAEGAKEAAVKLYPDLGVKDSTFNKTFVDLYAEASQRNPDLLTRADWPLVLANRAAQILSVSPATPTPVAVAAPPPPPPPPTPGALDRGTYNQRRSTGPGATPWIRRY